MKTPHNVLARLFPSSLLWSYFLFLLFFSELWRLGLLLRNWNYFQSVASTAQLFLAFVYGMKADQIMSAYLMLPPAILGLVLCLAGCGINITGFCVRILMVLQLIPMALLGWGEMEFFSYFRDRYNGLATEFTAMPQVILQTIWDRFHPIAILFLTIFTIVFFYWALLVSQRKLAAKTSRTVASACILVTIALAILIVRGGWGLVPARLGGVYFSSNVAANQLALNGVVAFANEFQFYGEAGQHEYYPEELALERARSILRNPNERYTRSATDPLEKMAEPQMPSMLATDKPNIVLILMESLSAQDVGLLGGPLAATPEFDRLSKDGFLYTRYYSQGMRTGRALFSVLAGTPAPPGSNIFKYSAGRRTFTTIATLLKPAGYRCSFVYGGDLDFESMDGFLKQNGFDELIGVSDFAGGRLWQWRTKWGVPDHIVFDRMHEMLSERNSPNFIVTLTLSNHPPYRLPPEGPRPFHGPLADERNAIAYSDWALGRFIEKARLAPYFKKTLFIITGDHGEVYEGVPSSDLTIFHVPCLFYGPDVLKVPPARIDALACHSDLATTIIGLLGFSARYSFWGRDLMHQPDTPSRVLISTYRSMLLVDPDRVLKDEKGMKPQIFAWEPGDRLRLIEEITTDANRPFLIKERSLTQVLSRLISPMHSPSP